MLRQFYLTLPIVCSVPSVVFADICEKETLDILATSFNQLSRCVVTMDPYLVCVKQEGAAAIRVIIPLPNISEVTATHTDVYFECEVGGCIKTEQFDLQGNKYAENNWATYGITAFGLNERTKSEISQCFAMAAF